MLPRTKCPLLLDPVSPGIHRQIGRTFASENLTRALTPIDLEQTRLSGWWTAESHAAGRTQPGNRL